jgi:hypothetical protein
VTIEHFDMSEAPPTVGAQLDFYGQAYVIEAVEPYTRHDGRPSAVIHWCTECPMCRLALVRFTTGLRGKISTRRCTRCAERRKAMAIRHSRYRPQEWKGKRI